ncbi:MAG: cyclase family protein [Eubacteriales bacterium]|nr:cyclase family protein [Eubacteriales bacterium]
MSDEYGLLDLTLQRKGFETRLWLPEGDLPLSTFCGAAGILDVRGDIVIDYNKCCEVFDAGDIMLLYTGESEMRDPDVYADSYSYLTDKLVDFIIERGIRLVGIDAPGVDIPGERRSLDRLLDAGISVIENLTHLSEAVGAMAPISHGEPFAFELFAFPIPCADRHALCRAVLRLL